MEAIMYLIKQAGCLTIMTILMFSCSMALMDRIESEDNFTPTLDTHDLVLP